MKTAVNIKRLKQATDNILNCGEEVGVMHQSVHEMYEVFCLYTSIDAFNQNDAEIILASGKAISPASAAHCLLEMVRTAKFLRGIKKAINTKLGEADKISILYAGCGPYATLITPLLTQYLPEQIEVDFLDINETSLLSANKVIQGLGFSEFTDQLYLADAATFKCSKDYDIVISETLQAALRAEPFVAIYQNLAPQLSGACLFIPQEVEVCLMGDTKGTWNSEKLCFENKLQQYYGTILIINNKTVLDDFKREKISIENSFHEKQDLKLNTTINVIDSILLSEGDCSLNIPLKILELEGNENIDIEFYYKQDYPAEIGFTIGKTTLTDYKPF